MKTMPQLLIVDDNKRFVDRVICLLERVADPSSIDTASGYEEAREAFLSGDYKVILLDINLPGKSGIELLKFFRKHNQEQVVIMITNHTDDYYRQLCIGLGATYFLDKSNDFVLLPGIVDRYFNVLHRSGSI